MRSVLPISLLALVLGAGSTAHAQDGASEPTPAQVRVAAEAFDKGREAYKAEEYVEAAEQFEKADSNAPSAAALELAIRARDKAGELDRAATLMSFALKRHPDDENLLKIASDLSKRANATLFELTANCDSPCDLTVGGKIVHGVPDTQRMLYVQPGKLTVRAGWPDNRNDSKQVEATAGGKGELNFVAPSTPATEKMAKEPDEPAPEPVVAANPEKDDGAKKSGGWSPTVFYVGAGLTAVVGGVLVWSGIDTLNNPGKAKVSAACAEPRQSNCQALYDQGRSSQTRTNVLIGATGAVGVATILVGVLATDWSGGKKASDEKAASRLRPRVDVAPWASLDGGGLQAVGRF
jgi:tetratricopeptide (TPR) repeat protein